VEVQQGGPLSYDLSVPDKDPSAQRGILFALGALVLGWVVVVVGGWFALGFLSTPMLVVRGFPLALVGFVLLASLWGAKRAMPRARQRVALVALVASAGAGFLAYTTLLHVKPTIPQMRYELDRATPAGFVLQREETSGDRLCRLGCPTVKRSYLPPAGDEDPVRTFVLALFGRGWDQTTDVAPELATSARRGEVRVHLQQRTDGTVEVTATRQ
jgi:hypothetical protein